MGNFNRNMFLVGLSGFFILSVVCFFAIYTAVPDANGVNEILSSDVSSDTTDSNVIEDNSESNSVVLDSNENNSETVDDIDNFIDNEIDYTQEIFDDENDIEEEVIEEEVIEEEIIEEEIIEEEIIEEEVIEEEIIEEEVIEEEIIEEEVIEEEIIEEEVKKEEVTSSNTTSSSSNSASNEDYVQLPSISSSSNGGDTVNIIAAGDNLIHTGIYLQAAARANSGYDFDPAYANIKDYIKKADIASLNQETVMSKSYEPASYPRFNTPIEMADTIKDLGFDVVSLANNHAGDKGSTGLYETLDLLKNQKNLTVVGSYFNQSDYNNIPIFDVNGIKVSYVAATQWTNDLRVPTDTGLVTSYIEGEAEVKVFLNQIAKAKSLSDIVVVNIHWGFENSLSVNSFQTGLAERMVASGADIIVGHHPHVLQPVEFIKKKDGTYAVCYYSLGNLISAQSYGERMIGGLADITIGKVDGKVSIVDAKLIPVITHFGSNYSNIHTYTFDNYSSELANVHGVKGMYTPSFSMDYIYNVVTKAIDRRFLTDEFLSMYGGTSYSNAS